MKAKYIMIKAGYDDLTLNEVYHVEDVQCAKNRKGRSYGQVEKIQIKHGEVAKWYDAKFFELYAEAAAALPAGLPAAADAAMPAAMPATRGFTAKECIQIGEAIAAGFAQGIQDGLAGKTET